MGIHLLQNMDYQGDAGIQHMRELQQQLTIALEHEDWDKVRRLDSTCMCLIERVIAANKDDGDSLIAALSELKGVYSSLIVQCQREVAALAH